MRKHHKKWNVVQSGHCTIVLLHLAASHKQAASRYRDNCNVARRHASETPPQRLRSAGGSSDAIGQHTHKSRCR